MLFAEAVDDVDGGFGHEGFVVELALSCGEAFFVFGEVFGEALAFGGDVDLAFVDNRDIEVIQTSDDASKWLFDLFN